MAWRHTGDKPLSEPMVASFNDIYASLDLNELIMTLDNVLLCYAEKGTYLALAGNQCDTLRLGARKWPTFCRRYFLMHFPEINIFEFLPKLHQWLCKSYSLLLNRQQVITWTNDGPVHCINRPQRVNTWRLRQNGHLFGRQHFHIHFLGWKSINFDWYFTEMCS